MATAPRHALPLVVALLGGGLLAARAPTETGGPSTQPGAVAATSRASEPVAPLASTASAAPTASAASDSKAPPVPSGSASPGDAAGGCDRQGCHAGIEPIRDADSAMMRAIEKRGQAVGDARGCVVCHGGDPGGESAEQAHRGAPAALQREGGPDGFYPDPGSPWLNDRTCGPCHEQQVRSQHTSLMMTEAGKIQGVTWAFGLSGYEHKWGNYAASSPNSPDARVGSAAYRSYMAHMRKMEPNVYPDHMDGLPDGPSDAASLVRDPGRAAFSYARSECQRCHVGVRGRQSRGDYRGMGCSACHIPYGNEGVYEGNDPSIAKTPGHLLVHSIQSSRKVKVAVHGKTYTGIPVETCTTCHDRGKRIGVSFQGLMESAYASPFVEGGGKQPKLHSKHYMAMQQDIHYQKGMMCLDCHTSIDVHGDGFLFGTNLSQVQIECQDCHGTPDRYPWELPLGAGEEFEGANAAKTPRGTVDALPARLRRATVYPAADGYLLTARGNPLRNVVRKGNRVLVHTAGGKDLDLTPLKSYAESRDADEAGRVAMVQVKAHLNEMECYSCHGSWAPQCYGCHVRIDYTKGKRAFDWVEAGRKHGGAAHRKDRGEGGYDADVAGRVHEERSYLRWANPMLVVDGEGRVSPGIPGCQVSATIVGYEGETILQNHIFRTPKGTEGGGEEGQLSLDMSPTQPHTTGKARPCESCHASRKALGYGIAGGGLTRPWSERQIVDLSTADGEVLPRSARTQLAPIEGLDGDWSRIVTEDGQQLMTVGHHFQLSRPLDPDTRRNMSREGICLSCHREIPAQSLAVSLLHHVAKVTGQVPRSAAEHDAVVHKSLLLAGWVQVLGTVLGGLLLLGGVGAGGWWVGRGRRLATASRSDGDVHGTSKGQNEDG